tara:strand:+ start:4424 stop:4702 length:279 start_codon:yes stop_codon:yes gene_type:complete
MSEVDTNSMLLQNADFSQLSNDMNKMEKDIQILLNIGYFLLGTVTTIGGVMIYKCISKCLKQNKVVKVNEEEIKLLDSMDKKLDNIAVAVKV